MSLGGRLYVYAMKPILHFGSNMGVVFLARKADDKLAAEIAAYEKGRECGSVHEDYDEMDRIEKDIVRARKEIDLYHRYFGEHVDRAVVCK